MELAGKVEESKQRCALCQLDVLDCHLVEHYTSHYSLEQPGLMVKVLVAKNRQASLRCPLNTCKNQEMAAAELDLHIATEHEILKAVLEEDARMEEKGLLETIFYWEEKVQEVVLAFGENKSESQLDPRGMMNVNTDIAVADNLEAEANDHYEDGEIEDDDTEDEAENAKDNLERMFQDARTVNKSQRTNDKDEELHQQDLNFGSTNKIEIGEMGSSDENMNTLVELKSDNKKKSQPQALLN